MCSSRWNEIKSNDTVGGKVFTFFFFLGFLAAKTKKFKFTTSIHNAMNHVASLSQNINKKNKQTVVSLPEDRSLNQDTESL